MNDLVLTYLPPQRPHLQISHILRYWEVGLPHMNLGKTTWLITYVKFRDEEKSQKKNFP